MITVNNICALFEAMAHCPDLYIAMALDRQTDRQLYLVIRLRVVPSGA